MKKKIVGYDSWGRAKVVIEDTVERYPEQLQLQLNSTREATPEEAQEWLEKELLPLGKFQLKFVAMMSIVQISTLGLMLLAFYIISLGLEK
tara:strand:+ start:512 stop:784 length:273 start_codon:yes stop_codon:yes gene_type:complete